MIQQLLPLTWISSFILYLIGFSWQTATAVHYNSNDYDYSSGISVSSREKISARRPSREVISANSGNLYLAEKYVPQKCERLTESQCADIGYNTTRYPNFAGDTSAVAAADSFATFAPFFGVKCAKELPLFLCSVHFPMCTEKVPISIGPCRQLCERVRKSCITVLKEFGFPWPASLECNKFPAENTQDQMCMSGEPIQRPKFSIRQPNKNDLNKNEENKSIPSVHHNHGIFEENFVEYLRQYILPGGSCLISGMYYMNRSSQCVPLCESTRGYTSHDVSLARSAILLTSAVSTALGFICVAVSIFLRRRHNNSVYQHNPSTNKEIHFTSNNVDIIYSKGKYTRNNFENTLIFSTLCFAICGLLQVFSIYEMRKLACISYNGRSVFVVLDATPEHTPCTFFGVLLYFFSSAARLWWVLAAWRRILINEDRSHVKRFDQMRQSAFSAHLMAWCVPLTLCTLALMVRSIVPEPLTAICRVGGSSGILYRLFVLLPDIILSISGILVLTIGTYCRNLYSQKSLGKNNSSIFLQRFITLEGFICALFPLIATSLLAAQLYEYYTRSNSLPYKSSHFATIYVEWTITMIYRHFSNAIFGSVMGLACFIYFVLIYCIRHLQNATFSLQNYNYHTVNESPIVNEIAYDESQQRYEDNINSNGINGTIYYGRARTFSSSSAYQPLQLEMPSPAPMSTMTKNLRENSAYFKIASGAEKHDNGLVTMGRLHNTAQSLPPPPPNTLTSAPTTSASGTSATTAIGMDSLTGSLSNGPSIAALPPPPPPPQISQSALQPHLTIFSAR